MAVRWLHLKVVPAPFRFSGAVLAGGASRRMGVDKAFAVVGGRPMVEVAVTALAEAGALEVRVVGGDMDRLVNAGFASIADRWPGEGPLGGMIDALEWSKGLRADHVVVLGCDLPCAASATVKALVNHAAKSPGPVVVPVVDARAQWLHACWPIGILPALRGAFTSGERALHRAVDGFPVLYVEDLDPISLTDANWPCEVPEPEAGALDVCR